MAAGPEYFLNSFIKTELKKKRYSIFGTSRRVEKQFAKVD